MPEGITIFPPDLDLCRTDEGPLPDVTGLPAAVDATHRLIAQAVDRCDFAALHEIAAESPNFIVGDPEAEDICGEVEGWPLGDRDLVPIPFAEDVTTLPALLAGAPVLTEGFFGPAYVWEEDPGFRIVIDQEGDWTNYDHTEHHVPCETIWCTC